MNAPVLDTLRTAQTLKTAGFPPEQAEATARVLGDALADVATKSDVDNAVAGLKLELNAEIARVDAKLDAMDQKFETKFDGVNQRLDSMEASTQRQFDGVQKQFDGVQKQFDGVQRQLDGLQNQLVSFADHSKFHTRVTYGILAIIVGLLLASLVAPYISWGDQAAATPTESPAPAAEEPSAEPQAVPELPPDA